MNDYTENYTDLVAGVLERTFRDIGLILHGDQVCVQSADGFDNLVDAADWLFDEWNNDTPYSAFWCLQQLSSVTCARQVLNRARKHVLDYWTIEKISEHFPD